MADAATAAEVAEESATDTAADETVLLALLLLRYSAHLRLLAFRRLATVQDAILQAAALVDMAGGGRARAVTELSAVAEDAIRAGYSALERDVQAELAALAALVSDALVRQIDDAVGFPVGQPARLDTTATVPVMGATLSEWTARTAGDLHFRLRRHIVDAADQRMAPTELLAGIRDAVDFARRSLGSILRTAVTAVLAVTTEGAARENGEVIGGYIHHSILDARTTKEICWPRSGLRWTTDRAPIGHRKPFARPPLHIGCRSHLSLVYRDLSDPDLPSSIRDRLARDGRAGRFARRRPAPEPTLEEWLARRTVAEQRAILGRARWDAWKAGTLTTTALLDQSGRPLTLPQIRKILGL